MKLSKRIGIQIRDRLGPRGRRWAEIGRVSLAMIGAGWKRFPRTCNVCGYAGAFYPTGFPSGLNLQFDAGCPGCGSQQRHRLLKLWLDANQSAASGRVLHFAPEAAVRSIVEPIATEYIASDIDPHRQVSRVLDIEQIDLPEECVDTVICSHILEHVDDRRALSELYRILAPEGVLLIMVPIVEGWDETYENPDVSTDRDRLLHFGQIDHVRYYGRDLRDRIRAAGFALDTFAAREPHVNLHGLSRGETLFVATKPKP